MLVLFWPDNMFALKDLFSCTKTAAGEVPRRSFTFTGAASILIATFFIAALAVPMMAVWIEMLQLDSAQVALTMVSYFAGCIFTLLFLARLSNYFGRKAVVLLSLLLGALAIIVFILTHSAGGLYLGRFLQGLSCGLASSAGMAWVVDTAPLRMTWLGTSMTAAGPNIGLALGTLFTGYTLEYGILNPSTLYTLCLLLFTLGALFVLVGSETMPFGTESLKDVLIPRAALPRRLRRIFVVSSICFACTWGLGSFFLGFAAPFSTMLFEHSNTFLAGLTYLLFILPNASSGIIMGKYRPSRTIPPLLVLFGTGAISLFVFLHYGLTTGCIAAIILAGFGAGGTVSTSLKLLMQDSTLEERAGIISLVYLLAYVGSITPNAVSSAAGKGTGMDDIGIGFALWVVVLVGSTFIMMAWIKKDPSPAERLRFKPWKRHP